MTAVLLAAIEGACVLLLERTLRAGGTSARFAL